MEERGGTLPRRIWTEFSLFLKKILNSAFEIYSPLLIPPMADKCLSRRAKTRKGMIKERARSDGGGEESALWALWDCWRRPERGVNAGSEDAAREVWNPINTKQHTHPQR